MPPNRPPTPLGYVSPYDPQHIIDDWEYHSSRMGSILVSQATCDRYLPLWFAVAPAESWDIYLHHLSKEIEAFEDILYRVYEEGDEFDATSEDRSQLSKYNTFMKTNFGHILLIKNERQDARLSSLTWETFETEFPLASQATGTMLADLIQWLSSVDKKMRLPELKLGRPAVGDELVTDILGSFNMVHSFFEEIFDQIITIGLWQHYLKSSTLSSSASPLSPKMILSATLFAFPLPPSSEGRSDTDDSNWAEIIKYFRIASEYAVRAPRGSKRRVYRVLELVTKHAGFVAILAVMNQRPFGRVRAVLANPMVDFVPGGIARGEPPSRVAHYLHPMETNTLLK
ncbi:hypothetical protein BJ085DRAFT_29433 [Dimargaris cristalligena]|uniref:Uncharacterized protein n=1 Tax=Dimargaris cristalligena TaxID=215637 RepID=A0A4P9ZN50_9FUNG|nr:hypothetical protein BJ085DRAFT_29433 [Dimargaris cristalligena]|eukprot:RKP34021.1 hypothetical protein BJ085DRAFT_29433 [Dimargaris cristalligena]